MLDDLQQLEARWKFDVVRFHDASFGADEARARDFARGILARGLRFGWNALMAAGDVAGYADATLDALAESGLYAVEVGGANGGRNGSPDAAEADLAAARKLGERGIDCRVTYTIGHPGESDREMLATLDRARRCELTSPQSTPAIFRYRPVPGTRMWDEAVASGFRPPLDLVAWGSLDDGLAAAPSTSDAGGARGERPGEGVWQERISPDVARVRHLLDHYRSVSGQGAGGFLERLARWRLRTGNYTFGELDAKLWSLTTRGPSPPPPSPQLGAALTTSRSLES